MQRSAGFETQPLSFAGKGLRTVKELSWRIEGRWSVCRYRPVDLGAVLEHALDGVVELEPTDQLVELIGLAHPLDHQRRRRRTGRGSQHTRASGQGSVHRTGQGGAHEGFCRQELDRRACRNGAPVGVFVATGESDELPERDRAYVAQAGAGLQQGSVERRRVPCAEEHLDRGCVDMGCAAAGHAGPIDRAPASGPSSPAALVAGFPRVGRTRRRRPVLRRASGRRAPGRAQ